MTELQHQLVDAKLEMDKAEHGSDEWFYWSREHSRILNERQKEMQREKYPACQFERLPDEGLL